MTLLDAINGFIMGRFDAEYVPLQQWHLSDIQTWLRNGKKIDAIKCLRNNTQRDCTKIVHWINGNSFSDYLERREETFGDKHTLGLKVAKDIIDFIDSNPDL